MAYTNNFKLIVVANLCDYHENLGRANIKPNNQSFPCALLLIDRWASDPGLGGFPTHCQAIGVSEIDRSNRVRLASQRYLKNLREVTDFHNRILPPDDQQKARTRIESGRPYPVCPVSGVSQIYSRYLQAQRPQPSVSLEVRV